MSPRKVGIVAQLVRARTVADALTILEHTPRRSALPVKKVIESLQVTAGPRLKRFKPAAHGRALPFQKKTTHIHVVVSGAVKPKKAAAKPAAAKEEAK
jgi:large subunit ribosomal protein L22